MDLLIQYELPDADLYCQLRQEAGWDIPSNLRAAKALDHSLFGVMAYSHNQVVGMARVIGDGAMNVYVQDVIVNKSYRGQGIGTALVRAVVRRMKTDYPPSITVGLLASKGNEPLYGRFGFISRPSGVFGAGMIAALSELSTDI